MAFVTPTIFLKISRPLVQALVSYQAMIGTESPLEGWGAEGALGPLEFGKSENRKRGKRSITISSLDSKC